MPLVIDKDKMRSQILIAFHKCTQNSPIAKITIREVAEKAEMSPAKILYYFGSRQQLFLEYVQYVSDLYVDFYSNWLVGAREKMSGVSNREYVACLLKDIISFDNKEYTKSYVQVYSLAQFDETLQTIVKSAYKAWCTGIKDILEGLYKRDMASAADTMMVVIEGLLVYSLNDIVTEEKIINILSDISEL